MNPRHGQTGNDSRVKAFPQSIGTTTSPATNVTVNTSNAVLYADVTFASTNQPWVNGNNTFTAIAKDAYGRRDTNSITVLQATNVYTYDLNGNLLYDGRRAFAYDDENQLIRVTVTNSWKSEFTYDGKLRRRIVKEFTWNGSWVQTNEVHYIYDGNLVVQERDANNLPQVTYTRGTDLSGSLQGAGGIGGLLARTDNSKLLISDPFATAFYHADGNGNITALVYTNHMIAAKYLYDPYGNMLSMYGSLAEANSYRFSSKEWNANSGLYYYLYRLYDPNFQRWLNRDPIGENDGANLYEIVGNDLEDYCDEFGLQLFIGSPIIEEPIIDPIIRPINIPIRAPTPKPTPSPIPAPAPPAPPVLPPKCPGNDSHDDDCKKQWADARQRCAEELAKPNPSRDFTGGHKTIDGCAKGHVTQDCGGNYVPPPPPKPPRRIKRWGPEDFS